jgi:hypothetical protein
MEEPVGAAELEVGEVVAVDLVVVGATVVFVVVGTTVDVVGVGRKVLDGGCGLEPPHVKTDGPGMV